MTTIVIRETSGTSVGPTARDSMLSRVVRTSSPLAQARRACLRRERTECVETSVVTPPLRRHSSGDHHVVVAGSRRNHRPHHGVFVHSEIDNDGGIVHCKSFLDRAVDVVGVRHLQAVSAVRLGQLHEIWERVRVQIGVRVALVIEQRLPLAHHSEAGVECSGAISKACKIPIP